MPSREDCVCESPSLLLALEVVGRASVVVLPNARARSAGAVKGIVMSGGAQEHAGREGGGL